MYKRNLDPGEKLLYLYAYEASLRRVVTVVPVECSPVGVVLQGKKESSSGWVCC